MAQAIFLLKKPYKNKHVTYFQDDRRDLYQTQELSMIDLKLETLPLPLLCAMTFW